METLPWVPGLGDVVAMYDLKSTNAELASFEPGRDESFARLTIDGAAQETITKQPSGRMRVAKRLETEPRDDESEPTVRMSHTTPPERNGGKVIFLLPTSTLTMSA